MRFVSPHARYSFQAQGLEYTVVSGPQGAMRVPTQQMILCEFQQGGLSPWELEVALEHLVIRGMPDRDTVPKHNRLAVFDTDMWQAMTGADDETRTFVERRLLQSPDYGTDFIAIDKPRIESPWPKYDEIDDEDMVVQLIGLLGYSAQTALQYESENLKRPRLMQRLKELAETEQPPDPEKKLEPINPADVDEYVNA
jgi:hypothetical protein